MASVVCAGLVASAAQAQVYKVLYNFPSDFSGGKAPHGPLIRASDGHFYGTTEFGGSQGSQLGTVFRLVTRGLGGLTYLHDFFDIGDGSDPNQALLESSGYLFGSTPHQDVNIPPCDGFSPNTYRVDFVGNLSNINCPLSTPDMSALVDAFGGLWGVTTAFFRSGLFRMDASGTATILDPLVIGNQPLDGTGELLLASDGNVYGLAVFENGGGAGVLFRSDAAGHVTIMHGFTGVAGDGAYPSGRLVEQGGFLWGTTRGGGASGEGAMFRMDFAGNVAILHSFAGGIDGAQPTGGLLVANLSSFYGTTAGGGLFGGGTLYQIDSFGSTTVLHSFGDAGDGSNPGPLLPSGASLYGTTQSGGSKGGGTIYLFMPDASVTPRPFRMIPTAGPVRVAPGVPVEIDGGIFRVGAQVSVTIGGLQATSVQVLDSETIMAATPPNLQPGTLNDVVVTTPQGTQGVLPAAWMADFLDVPESDRRHDFIDRVFQDHVMDGCGGGNFCENGVVNRGAITMIALKARHGSGYVPPACTGVFRDVPCPGPQADWIEQAVGEGIIEGCAPHKFCPTAPLTRGTFASPMLKTEHGSAYVPPPCSGVFSDVKCPSRDADAIEQLYAEGIVEACATDPLRDCPKERLTRGPMAQYAVEAFRLP